MIEERKKLILSMKEDIFGLHKEFLGKLNTKVKGENPRDIVTDADLAVEEFLVKGIRKISLEDKVIGEETGVNGGGNGFEWYIDPIDGTAYFASGNKEYGTSVGLVFNGEIVFGAIFHGEDGKVYWAEDGKGAFCDDERIAPQSKEVKISESRLVTGLNYDQEEAKKDFDAFRNLYTKFKSLWVQGSCVTNLIRVATGRANAYWEPYAQLSPYDFCAGALLVKETGGFASHKDPEKFITPEKGNLFASNGIHHQDFVELVKKCREI